MCRLPRFAVVLAVASAMTGPGFAERLEWQPRVFLSQSRTDNVNYVTTPGTTGTSTPAADTFTILGFEIPVSRTTRSGAVGFNYFGVVSRYTENDLYDNFSHGATFYVRPQPNRRTTFSVDGFATLSQDQGASPRFEDDEQFVTVRTDRRFYGVGTQYGRAGRRSRWTSGLRVSRAEYEVIDGTFTDPDPPDPDTLVLVPEGRTYASGHFEYRHDLTRRFSLGPRYTVGYTDLERNGDDLYHVLTLAFGQQVSPYFSYGVGAGLSRRTLDDASGVEHSGDTDFAWSLTLGINPPLPAIESGQVKVDFDIGITPSAGGSLEGVSADTYARLYLSSGTPRSPWSWGVGGRYTRRESTVDTVPRIQTLGASGSVEYGIGNLVSLSLGAGWSKQLNADVGTTNASFGALRLGVVVYPKGRASSP